MSVQAFRWLAQFISSNRDNHEPAWAAQSRIELLTAVL